MAGDSGNWVDPREHPDPPLRVPFRPPAPDVTGLLDLLRLCREGHLYEVEKWIQEGKPLQALDYRHGKRSHQLASPLKVAVETGQFDLAQLLLCNGFQPDLERESILEIIVRSKAKDYLDLLISWGADPKRVKPSTVIDTYEIQTMEMFWEAGDRRRASIRTRVGRVLSAWCMRGASSCRLRDLREPLEEPYKLGWRVCQKSSIRVNEGRPIISVTYQTSRKVTPRAQRRGTSAIRAAQPRYEPPRCLETRAPRTRGLPTEAPTCETCRT
jgi:hypothetical protein